MSRFLSPRLECLEPYTPGEQPLIRDLIKLNTNESPFPPSEKAVKEAEAAAQSLHLYPDPECKILTEKIAETLGVNSDEVLVTNGSDEILNFAFMAFCDADTKAVFPDITYGFYKVFAQVNNVPYKEIPLNTDLKIVPKEYFGANGTIFIANPNAPTGDFVKVEEIEKIIQANPRNVVVIDEAYVDFGAESCVPLIKKYDNLLVTQTFSKSRSMAGARLGFGVASKELIADLNRIKYSTNPYNINRMTMAAGIGVLNDEEYTLKNCAQICENRKYTEEALLKIGFEVIPSKTNFVFAKHPGIAGDVIYKKLRERSILVRHFESERISQYNRITVGTKEQMEKLVSALREILKEEKK